MKTILEKKAVGFYFVVIAVILAVASLIRFTIWAPNHHGMDVIIIAAIVLGVVLDVFLMIKENEYILILAVVCYSIGAVKLLTNSVGSFVDAIQGINMFGDSSQVGNILSISIMILLSVLASIIAAFLKQIKEL
ncbi:MAG: hypothetical protein PHW34_03205 [Hespellia sp.]|nr:hypothetical protein [Hespellia sp.]